MKKLFKKSLAIIMVVVMTLTAAPLSGFVGLELPSLFDFKAEAVTEYTSGYYTYTVTDGEATITDCDDNISGNIVIPSTLGGYPVTVIGKEAFDYCDSLTNITIPEGVKTIGEQAFYSCDSLVKITIPNSVASIGVGAFEDNDSLESVKIGNGVKTIGKWAFYDCNVLTSITVETDNRYYSSDSDGVLFNKDKTILIQYPIGSSKTNYIIPNDVTKIDSGAFAHYKSLASVVITNSVTTIGDYAFEYCENLISIILPNSVTTICEGAFAFSGLTNIDIPDTVTTIGSATFAYCSNLKNVILGNQVKSIEEYTFLYCESLTDISVPNSIIKIGEGAFMYCENLTGVVIPEKVVSIGAYAFGGCYSLTSLTIPDSVITIGEGAFQACTNISSVNIGKGVTSIGEVVFVGCWSLTSIEVSTGNNNYSSDDYGVLFDKNKNTLIQYPLGNERKNYTIPNSVTTIGDYAFFYCFNLTSIIIPDSVTTIGDYAFDYCESLTDVYYKGTQAQWKRISISDDNECLTNANIHYIYSICSREFDKNLDYYAENWDSANYNPELANIMAALSKAVYSENDIDSACEALGFVGYGVYDYDTEYNPHTCGYSLAFKKSDYNDDIICLVSVRGSQKLNYNADWIGNFMFMTEETKHKGFSDPANNIYEAIQNETENMTGNIKYFITGHSRGAAVANLLSVKLMENGVSSSDVYNYNFACPDVACRVTFTEYDNIFNLCNREDIVPFIPGSIASAFTTPGTSWGKFGQTYWFTKDAPDTIDPFADHDKDLYLEFFDQQLMPSDWGENFKDKWDDAVHTLYGWITKIMCPVDVVITDENGNNIASVIGGEVNYYNSQVGNVLIFTDGDKKVIYINGDNDFNVNLVGTDSGEMTYSVERYNVQGEEVLESKTFTNVKLEEGKQMFSPVSNADNADDVELFVTEIQNGQQVVTHTVSTSGTETAVENETPDNPDGPSDPTIDWEEIAPEINEPSKTTIKFGDTLVLKLEEIEIPDGYAIAWFVEGAGVSTWVSEDGLECRVTSIANGNPTIYAKLVDEEENVVINADGEEIFDEITLVSKAGFWQRFISFFKNLFGINRVIY